MESKKTTKERLINQLETLDSEHEGTGKPGKAIVINYQALLDVDSGANLPPIPE